MTDGVTMFAMAVAFIVVVGLITGFMENRKQPDKSQSE